MIYNNAIKLVHSAPSEIKEDRPGTRIRLLWKQLGEPQKSIRYVRFIGSGGKTVCAEMLSSIYQESEYTTGSLTFPLQEEFRNNIRIGHRLLPLDELASYAEQIHTAIKSIRRIQKKKSTEENGDVEVTPFALTQHELLLTIALLAFRAHQCKLCIIESDCTSEDPTRHLPSPLLLTVCGSVSASDPIKFPEIRSYAESGIKEMICSPQDEDGYGFLSELCAAINCRLTMPSRKEISILSVKLTDCVFLYRGKTYELKLCGVFQVENAILILEIVAALGRIGFFLSEEVTQARLREIRLPGKCEILSVSPTIVADTSCHQRSIEVVCDALWEFRHITGTNVHFCLPEGMLADQAVQIFSEKGYEISSLLAIPCSEVTKYYPPQKNYAQLRLIHHTVQEAISALGPNDLLLLCGPSAFTSRLRHEFLKQLGF